MAVTITRTQIRQEMLKRAPILGRVLTADSITKAGPSLTQPAEYERQRAGLTSFENQYIHRYNRADPDRWRLITALNSGATDGVVNVDGPAYLDNADLAYERLTIHPDDLNFAIAQGQRRQRVRTNIPLVRGHDMDIELAGTNYWGTVVALGSSSQSNVTLTKVSNDTFSGTQSMTYLATANSNYCRGEALLVNANRQIYAAIIARCGTGTFTFRLYDSTNAVYIGDTITITGPCDFKLMEIRATTTTDCNLQYEFSTGASGNTAAIDTCFGPYQAGQTEYPLQAAINEAYKLRYVRPAAYTSPLSVQGTFDAYSSFWMGDLTTPEDWEVEAFRRDVNSNRLRFISNSYNNNAVGWGLPQPGVFMQSNMRPIWLAWEAQVSDFEPLLTEASTTSQPLDECACYSLRWLAETAAERDPTNPVWQNMLKEYKLWSVIEDQSRPPQPMHRPQRLHQIRA